MFGTGPWPVQFHGLPNVQDEPYAAEYRPTVVFNGLSNVQDETYPPLDHQNTGPLSCSVPLMLVHVSDLSGSSLLPLLHMLVHFLSNVNSVFKLMFPMQTGIGVVLQLLSVLKLCIFFNALKTLLPFSAERVKYCCAFLDPSPFEI